MSNNYQNYLSGGGEMGKLTRDFDWSGTSLGSPDQWPLSLLTAISIILNSKFPMFIWWGPELIQFYNDAYRPSLGQEGKHPDALGQPGEACWQEIWPVIKPLIDQVLGGGESTWSEDQLIPIFRNNRLEEVYWTFSYSKLLNENGQIGGILVTCTETTNRVIALNEITRAKSELEFAINATDLGTWDLDPITNKFKGNHRLKKWFGLPPEAEIELERATDVILESDRKRVLSAIQKTMNYESGGHYDIEYTIISPLDPTPRLVRAVGKTIFDSDQEPIRFSGTLQDVTHERDALEKLFEAHQRLELSLDQSLLAKTAAQLGTFDMDLLRGTMDWDERCRVLFGISHKQNVSYEDDFVGGLHPEDRERILTTIEGVFDKAKTNGNYDVEYRTVGAEDGVIRWVKAKGRAYFDAEARPVRFIGAVLDITEQKTDEIRKNDFIGMVSHELKTPLTSLKGYIQFLGHQSTKKNDEFTAGILNRAEIQIGKMTSLINGFLDVSRLEAGKINLNKKPVDLNVLAQNVIEDLSMISSSHPIKIFPCLPVVVNVDADKITSVITNLLSNAIKYSPDGSKIEVHCEIKGDCAELRIVDQGPGIRPSDAKRLFERFYRVEETGSKVIPGFGIGLYLCAEIIERHGGKIGVISEPGEGATFHFMLPLN